MGQTWMNDFWLLWVLLSMCHLKIFYAKCGGKSEINGVLNGTIKLGDPYPQNTHCQWLIRAPLPGQRIVLMFRMFKTECSYDYFKVYDGSSTAAKLLAALSGDTLTPVFRSSSSSVLLDFFSDNNYVLSGWDIYFEISNCSGGCSDHGSCLGNKCSCNELYTGDACDVKLCPEMCNNITGNGECSKLNGECLCNEGYVGQSCSLFLPGDSDIGVWHAIKETSDIFHARFGHAGQYVKENNALWIFGGSDLNIVFDDLVKFDFIKNKWFLINSTGPSPAARFHHTMVAYKDTLVLFGGKLSNGTHVNDIWSFNISRSDWKLLPRTGAGTPPGLASHTANVVDDKLFIFGGHSQEHEFTNEMYTYDLNLVKGWQKVIYKLAKKSDLRLVGHSSVFYPALRSLVVFGGFRQSHSSPSEKSNAIYMYNVEHKIWIKIREVPSQAKFLPQPRAYHSAVVAGDYMVVYGGNVHKHKIDETCYENKLHLFNLKSFSWISPSLLTAIGNATNPSYQPQRGRFSLVASVLNGSIILVSGGFSGIAHRDLLAYKLPINIASGSVNITVISSKHCSLYDKSSCALDPSCMWCDSSCLSLHESNSCSTRSSSVAPHVCSVFAQCISCLVWGSQPDLSCGWCVQDSRCYPRISPSGVCSPHEAGNTYSTRGWWGDSGSFLTILDQCRTDDKPPGLMVNVHFQKKHIGQPDLVSILNPLCETFNRRQPGFSDLVYVRMFGFIFPFISNPVNSNVDIKLRVSKQSVSLRISTDEDPSNMEKVISLNNEYDVLKIAGIENSSVPLFPNAAVNKMYYMEINSEFTKGTKDAWLCVYINGILLNGSYVRPFFSSDCSVHSNCLQCLSDASCGWYSDKDTCVRRNDPIFSYSADSFYLIINATFCKTCAQYIDCLSCLNSTNCGWRANQVCDRYEKVTTTTSCLQPCNSNKDCGSCVEDAKCFWCRNKKKCIPSFSYVPDNVYGQCSHWNNKDTVNGQCGDCSKKTTCEDCQKESYCGWCGENVNGNFRCFDGGYDGPNDGKCEQLMSSNHSNNNSSLWSYTRCPDVNECINKSVCDGNATCTNFDGSYKCECRIGFEGNGVHCHVSCNPPCLYGKCDSSLTCDCDLGWTGNNCSEDCGCNNHSACNAGINICDKCQEFTYGEHCEFCLPGSYGNATTSLGCRECQCNGHGDEQRGICDVKTGECFCSNDTMGAHCNQCLPGLIGHPEGGGGCYHPCESHYVLSNVTHGSLSTGFGPGADNEENTSCVWIITTSRNKNEHIIYSSEALTGTITLRIKDLHVNCQTDHVYVYDGFLPYKHADLYISRNSSFNMIASICGLDASNVPTIESRTGILVVVFKGNLGSHSPTKGVNATFIINRCPDVCTGNRYCFNNVTHHECVCKAGWTGRGCDDAICPANCSKEIGQGYCDQALKSCVCAEGFSGVSCDNHNPFVWKLMFNINERTSTLPRMGNTMVADEITQSLIIYGGYSFRHGILGDTWIYDITKRHNVRIQDSSKGPTPRYLHAAAVYKRHMYISGGITDGEFSSELWKFDFTNSQWTRAQVLPNRIAGHTLNVVYDTMYQIGGYDPNSYCSSKVYVLQLDSNSPWTELSTSGDTFNACFGHTTVYDKKAKSLIVFGKDAEQIMSGSGSSTLAVLQLTTQKWTVELELPQSYSRSFHLSVIVDDVMVVHGGYTSNGRVQDFAEISLVYNIRCRQWEKLDEKGVSSPTLAHSSTAVINDEVYIFGGYNGIASDKIFRLNISSDWCSIFSTRDKCVGIGGCHWCIANATNQSFCFNSIISSSSHNCSSDVVRGDQCGLNPAAAALKHTITSSSDVCTKYSFSKDCSSCVLAKDNNGKSASCFWAVDSLRCLSAHFTPLLCVFGICGRMLREYDVCPGQCHLTRYCHDCLEQYNCGWCADPSWGNGNGTCIEGTIKGSLNGICQRKNLNLGIPVTTPIWISSVCLLEDECLNGHHRCHENETCFNLENQYGCRCKSGYIRLLSKCIPVCHQGCVNGHCIDPDVCRCYFGFVGSNCSTSCQCHGNGDCMDESQLDNCTNCRKNTVGRSCERCLPGFVGKEGSCIPCSEKCNNNADECYSNEDYRTLNDPDSAPNPYGPKDNHVCKCKDNSYGQHCHTCEDGYFKLRKDLKCEQCRCRGHSRSCRANTGLDCKCNNNTKNPSFCSMPRPNNGCYYEQCSMCEAYYIGNPKVIGQQCYYNMKILQHLSLTRKNSAQLFPGQTNFFYVKASYTNTDIRLTFDVFDGFIDVYIATRQTAFKVAINQTVSISSAEMSQIDIHSDGLNKYITYSGNSMVTLVKDINRRLVVTFPFEEHQLNAKQIFVVVKAGYSGADGITYFKQDNVKIDLVVFFAVFFSCVFLFLSVIVIGWSIKHHIHSRQEVHNREIQTERLQSRPFAKFPFIFEYQAPSPSMLRHRKTTASTRKAIRAIGVQATNDCLATVSTVMIQMPQTEKTKMSIILGTALTTMNPHHLDRLSLKTAKVIREMETTGM